MDIVVYVFVGLYAVLTGVAGGQQWKEQGFHVRTCLFVLVSISILVTICLPNKELVFILLIVEFVLLQLLAMAEGIFTNGKMNYRHQIIRFLFHCLVLVMVYKFLM